MRYTPNLPTILAAALGLACCIASGAAYVITSKIVEENAFKQFEYEASKVREALRDRLSDYQDVVTGLSALFGAVGPVSRMQFHQYANGIDIAQRFPGIQNFNYVEYVPSKARAAFEEKVRQDTSLEPNGYPNFAITPPGQRDAYYVLLYCEPTTPNNDWMGKDLAVNARAAEALELSRDTGKLISSGHPFYVGNDPKRRALAMRLPVYRPGMPLTTVVERRAAYIGSVGVGFDIATLLRKIPDQSMFKRIGYQLYDAGPEIELHQAATSPTKILLHSSHVGKAALAAPDAFTLTSTQSFAGRKWEFQFSADKAAMMSTLERQLPMDVLAISIVFNISLFIVFYSIVMSRRRALALASTMTNDLRESEARLEQAQHMAQLGNWQLDCQSGVLTLSALACRIFGRSGYDRQMAHHEFINAVHPDDRHFFDWWKTLPCTELAHADELAQFMSQEHRIIGYDGAERWVHTIARITFTGSIRNVHGTIMEITERVRVQAELQQAKNLAERALHARNAFLANMSHEIRTPMNAIIGLTRLFYKTQLSPDQREYLNLLRVSADSLLQLLNNILDISKIEAEKVKLDNVEFCTREAVSLVLKMFSAVANQKGLELSYYISREVPVILNGDLARLQQILVNLIGNALKFTEYGEVVVYVTQQSGKDGQSVLHFCVTDTGIGIANEHLGTIFHAFEQADNSTTRLYGGSGLGLAIASKLTSLMGGTLTVESKLGAGSTFHLTLPFYVSHDTAKPSSLAPPDFLGDMKVLIVDNNAATRHILAQVTMDWGMVPILASNGAQGLLHLRHAIDEEQPIPVVLIDATLPNNEGFVVAQLVKSAPELKESIVIMMLSSSDLSNAVASCQTNKIKYYLSKPIDPDELLNLIIATHGSLPTAIATSPLLQLKGPAQLASSTRASHTLNILVAEDHPINQRLVKETLEDRGHRVSVAKDGREAALLSERERFDVILMDVQMPEMDGYQAAREIRRRECDTAQPVYIIALTANAMQQDRELCLGAGMNDYIAKPIDPDLLVALIEAAPPCKDGNISNSDQKEHC